MRLRNTLLALLALGGLVAWIYFYEYRGEEGRKKAEEAEKKVFNFETGKVEGIELISPGSKIVLLKENGQWRMTEPIAARADGDEVSGLLSSLSWLEITGKFRAGAADLDTFKLKDPALKIVLLPGEGKPPFTLAVGDKAPIGSVYYAIRGDGTEVVTVSASVDRLLQATAGKLRYKKVVGVDSWNVSRFTISRGGSMVTFGKDGEQWKIESPSIFPAERGKVSDLLYDLSALTAEGFEPEEVSPEAAGLARPEATLRMEIKAGSPVTVEFSAKDPNGVVRARRTDMPEIFTLKGDVLDKLALKIDDYRDTRVAPIDRWEVSEIRAATPDGEKTLVKDSESNWRWGSADGPVLGRKAVDDLLDALEAAKASGFREGSEAAAKGIGASSPPVRITVKAGSAAPVEVRFGAEEAGKVLVSSTASPAIYEVEKSLAERLLDAARSLKAPSAVAGSQPGNAP